MPRFVGTGIVTGFYEPMQNSENRDIEQASQKVRERMPIEKLRLVPKYRDLSAEDYEQLIKNAETIALLILKALFLKK